MTRRLKLILAAAIGVSAVAGGTGVAYAMIQADASASLRATGKVGEQVDGYLGIVSGADAALRAQVDAVNIKRRAHYTDLAAKRNAKIEEVAAATGCQLIGSRVQSGQFYRLSDGVWRKREGSAPIALPPYCA